MFENLLLRKSLVIELDHGLKNGKQVIKNKSFSNINEAASDQNLYEAAKALMSLQKYNILQVKKVDTNAIINK